MPHNLGSRKDVMLGICIEGGRLDHFNGLSAWNKHGGWESKWYLLSMVFGKTQQLDTFPYKQIYRAKRN